MKKYQIISLSTLLSFVLFLTFSTISSTPKISSNTETRIEKKVHNMGFQKLETVDTIVSINDPSVFNNVDTHLVSIFHNMEKDLGHPLRIKWGYRDPQTNMKAGGARNSAHVYGKALDIHLDSPSRETIKKLITFATKYGVLGIGVYSDAMILHIDIDEKKGRRAWGSSYGSNSIPSWASQEVKSHLYHGKTIPNVKVVETKKDTTYEKPLYYIIKKGDNAYRVSLNHNTTVDELYKLNGDKIKSFVVGQKIRLR